MFAKSSTRILPGIALAALALTASPQSLQAETKVVTEVAGVVSHATSRGVIAPDKDMQLTLWLAMPNKAEFDKRVASLYTPGSPTYHQWLSAEELRSYAPSDAVVKQVKEDLVRQGFQVAEDGRDNFSIRVHGAAEKVETAFNTRIEEFERNGVRFHANVTQATFSGASAKYVMSVSGLSNVPMRPNLATAKNPETGRPIPPRPLSGVEAASGGLSSLFTDQCFTGATAFEFGTPGALPIGLYFGNVYSATLTCGYTAPQMQAAYGLPAVYKAGLSGQGQTIVIVDAYGSPTILADANTFNSLNGLPALNSKNFQNIFPEGQPLDPALGPQLGWNVETSLDVEWAHAVAPSAKIVLLSTAAQDDQDFQYSIEYAITHKLGSVISNSYGSPEVEAGPAALNAYNQVIELGAAAGISVNFSTGDSGDYGNGSPVGAASTPADSPYATAVGGTSLGVPGGTGAAREVGWGNNQTLLAKPGKSGGTIALDPPVNAGNVGGAGGGESIFFAKPAYQKELSGTGRLLPDVAMEADPYTGAVLIFTDPKTGKQVVESIGGTSLSCPMFSAFWALANQKAGHLLGQAAPILSKLNKSELNDIVPGTSSTNVTGTVIDSKGATFYSAAALAAPLEGTTQFTSAVWPITGYYVDLTFGTDTSLMTAPGWDDVTGYGTPAGLNFVNAAARQ